jgi:hypothetical protein
VPRRAAQVVAAILLAVSGCNRTPADSPQFQEAFALYNQLYAKGLDDSYGDPQMPHVAELLGQVDPRSAQGPEAKDLLAKIQQGMADYRARAEKLAAMAASADAPVEFKGGGGLLAQPRELAPPPAPAGGPALGMTRDEFLARFADCFDRKGDYEQGDKRGEAFAVRASCAERFPTFKDSLVVLIDNHVTSLVPTKEVTVRTVDAGVQPGLPLEAPPPPPIVPPPLPAQVRFYPGAPRPDQASRQAGTQQPPPAEPAEP